MKQLICIECPRGCRMTVTQPEAGTLEITGNACLRGDAYARGEILDPRRTVTTTVATVFPDFPRLSVQTDKKIPLAAVFNLMEHANQVILNRRVTPGDVVVNGLLDGSCSLIATDDMKWREKIDG